MRADRREVTLIRIGTASIAIMWAALAPSSTHATPDLKSVFQMLDRNHDGAITFGNNAYDGQMRMTMKKTGNFVTRAISSGPM